MASRGVALVLWKMLLVAFWQGERQAEVGPFDDLFTGIEQLAARPWALALAGTLASASIGYAIGRLLGFVGLAGIAVGNTLTMTAAVLAGASVEGGLHDATVAVDGTTLLLALGLFTISLTLVSWLRRRSAASAGMGTA